MPHPNELYRKAIDAGVLHAAHPPRFAHAHKRWLSDRAFGEAVLEGQVSISHWGVFAPRTSWPPNTMETEIRCVEGPFQYAEPADGHVAWHLNFADPDVFSFYDGPLFAQDEHQVCEHPLLASVREALVADGASTSLVDSRGDPNPLLVYGVPRLLAIDTADGLYGNAFADARPEQVQAATTALDPSTRSNILAVAAPRGGRGRYNARQLESIFTAAFSAFCAASVESTNRLAPRRPKVAIHTGFWGCGAFGGNRVVMILLQIIAAQLARIDHVVIYTWDDEGTAAYGRAMEVLEDLVPKDGTRYGVLQLVLAIKKLGLSWGVGDGQ